MSGNLDFFSTKSGVKTRGMTSAADSEVSVVTSTLLCLLASLDFDMKIKMK